jgi:periplasmic protein TonB
MLISMVCSRTAYISTFLVLSLALHLALLLLNPRQPGTPLSERSQRTALVIRPRDDFKPAPAVTEVLPKVVRPSTSSVSKPPPVLQPQAREVKRPLPEPVAATVPAAAAASAKPAVSLPQPLEPPDSFEPTVAKLDVRSLFESMNVSMISWRQLSVTQPKAGENVAEGVSRQPEQSALPRYDINPLPRYPEVARRHGYQGTAQFRVLVLVDGQVGELELYSSSGYRSLDLAAEDAIRHWKFFPATQSGIKVASRVLVPINFVLED